MRVLDPGHSYALATLDGDPNDLMFMKFVKRIGKKYPGNKAPAYSGTTLQEGIRVLVDRAEYVNRQIPCAETEAAIGLLKSALLLFEIRAKRVKGKCLNAASVAEIVGGKCCVQCGHVQCDEHGHVEPPRDGREA